MAGRRSSQSSAPVKTKQREVGGKGSLGQAAPIRSRKGETISPTRRKRGSTVADDHDPQVSDLPLLRNSERGALKRCEFAWHIGYGRQRKPLSEAPALRFGSLIHGSLACWYIPGVKRGEHPAIAFERLYEADLKVNRELFGMKVDEDEKWVDAAELGVAMLNNYVDEYGKDDQWEVLVTEWPFQALVQQEVRTDEWPHSQVQPWFYYVGIVDGVWRDRRDKTLWIPDHKSTKGLGDNKYNYLQMDDQAGGYWSYGVQALRAAGMLKPNQKLHGMLYNFLAKKLPDERPSKVVKGNRLYLNLDGSISKKQPTPHFKRIPIFRDEADLAEAMRRAQVDFKRLELIKGGALEMTKSPGQFTCPMCAFRDACELHETGHDWEGFLGGTTQKWDPYAEHEIYDGR